MERDGVLRQRRHGLPQQRRARDDDYASIRTGNPVDRVTPLVRAKGAEVGVRTVAFRHLQSTLSVWMLRLDSELVFTGDAGTTEPSRPSARHGFEWTNYYSPTPWLVFDADVSWSRARFTDVDPVGNYVPEAVATVVSAGATVEGDTQTFGSLRWRYFGPRALIEDNSVRSDADEPVQSAGRLSDRAARQDRARRVQPVQRARQRHRLLLHVAAARRTARRHRRHPHASDAAAYGARRISIVGF